ncbi:MAG: ribonuclease J [Spirochaetes bacterium]|jgi:ribonuclease J|nr:ribonuclease J [Spirochaetota bacterium]
MKKSTKNTKSKSAHSLKSVKIIPIGGLDAIGRNMTVFECEDTILVVDCGIMFPTPEMPGIDFIIPDFSYLEKNREKIKGLVITHGHEDHIGAVPFFLKKFMVPVYGSQLTLGFIKKRLEERPVGKEPEFHVIDGGDKNTIGCFEVESIPVNHSIVGGMGLAIRSKAGTIVHSGDFKIDHTPEDGRRTDIARFAEIGKEGVLLLMSDSTNAERPGYTGTEKVLNNKLFEIFASAKARIIVATFASNISRIQQILNAAQKYNRKVIISGLTMQKNIEIARSLGFLNFSDSLIAELREVNTIPLKKQTIICTGTQGEPMSALTRISNGTHKHFKSCTGDTVIITASVIPGNERDIGVVINSLLKQDTIVHYEKSKDIHVSGHASQEELKLMMGLVKPKFFLPIHGEHKHLKAHAALALDMEIKSSGIIVAENGDILEMNHRSFTKTGHLPIRNVYTEGNYIGDISGDTIKDRQTISSDGIIYISVVLAENLLVHKPVIKTRGFSPAVDPRFIQRLQEETEYRLDKVLAKPTSADNISLNVRRSLKNMIYKQTRSNPIIDLTVIEI